MLVNLLRSKVSLLLLYLATFALLVYTCFLAYESYKNIQTLKVEIDAAMQPAAEIKTNNPKIMNTRQIASLFLFGKKVTGIKMVPQTIKAPATRLKLNLVGVVAANDLENSIAIIKIDNREIAVLKTGEQLPGNNAKVHQINPDQILLLRNGKLESLSIKRPELAESMKQNNLVMNANNIPMQLDKSLPPQTSRSRSEPLTPYALPARQKKSRKPTGLPTSLPSPPPNFPPPASENR